ncbi:conserved hypothetical protein [Methanolacinia petrolearia DSM 11571]|uniref:Holliday junction resolvase Hjc n=1 Tax=Methanolacinia petrolearia (strain DSM 11571 / OCM 486 / SEBR 4847) TaxID=679926 RepID=E1RK43_METP4|nr:hypothetical protein [Methanolacinia petrolearia]ADN35766.1 conserved hypothetical protein [Methanolacinia petrolearia DSM 11571]
MSDFERDIVKCFNEYFERTGAKGYAYRLKQSRFITQYVDVLSDSLDPRYYLAIECKSLKGKKLYFTQHFHEDKDGVHQVDAISEFIHKTGRQGFLAVEFRAGAGKPKEAYLLPWDLVIEFRKKNAGISKEDFSAGIRLERSGGGYTLSGPIQNH